MRHSEASNKARNRARGAGRILLSTHRGLGSNCCTHCPGRHRRRLHRLPRLLGCRHTPIGKSWYRPRRKGLAEVLAVARAAVVMARAAAGSVSAAGTLRCSCSSPRGMACISARPAASSACLPGKVAHPVRRTSGPRGRVRTSTGHRGTLHHPQPQGSKSPGCMAQCGAPRHLRGKTCRQDMTGIRPSRLSSGRNSLGIARDSPALQRIGSLEGRGRKRSDSPLARG